MSRLLLLITLLQVLIPGNFVFSSSSKRTNHLSTQFDEIAEIETPGILSQLGKRKATRSEAESHGQTGSGASTDTADDLFNLPNLRPEPSVASLLPGSSADNGIAPGSLDLEDDILYFALEPFQLDTVLFPLCNDFDAVTPFTLCTGPFRADVQGRTVVIDSSNFEEFQNNLMSICEVNPFFKQLSAYTRPHFLKKSESEAIQINLEFDENVPLITPPLHRLYELAREVLVYKAGKGQTEFFKEAIEAGMNLNFNIFFKPTKNRMNLLHWAVKSNGQSDLTELIKLLVQTAKIDPNALDSFGFAPLHYLAYMNNPIPSVMALLEVGANPNIFSARPDFNAPIHIAMKRDNYLFLKPFIYFESVNINLLDSNKFNLVHLAIKKAAYSCYSDLLKHPRILLGFHPLRVAFSLIKKHIPEEDTRYLDALAIHVINRRRVHVSHIHYIIFQLIHLEFVPALKAFHRQGFNFNFVHKSAHGRPDTCPFNYAIRLDRLESFKFLQSVGAFSCEPSSPAILSAVKSGSIQIIGYLSISQNISEDVFLQCATQAIEMDRPDILKMLMN